jgi:hypothetical protein
MPLKMILSYQNSDFFETDLKTRRLQLTISNQCPLCKLRNIYWNPNRQIWMISLKYQTLPNLKVWTPRLNLMALSQRGASNTVRTLWC